MLSAVSRDRFCDEAFADTLSNAGFDVGKTDYCGCKDTYYVVAQNGQKIWVDDVIIKNGEKPVRRHRPRIEVLQALVDAKISENDITKKP
jgi:hypothetical protein